MAGSATIRACASALFPRPRFEIHFHQGEERSHNGWRTLAERIAADLEPRIGLTRAAFT